MIIISIGGSKAMVFPVVMYGCESWSIKKTERQRTDAFELCCWRRLLRVPWRARRSNQSVLKEISPEYSLEGWCWSWNSNPLATWWEEWTHLKRPWCWERLKTGGEDYYFLKSSLNISTLGRNQMQNICILKLASCMLQYMGSQRVGHDWVTELNWY